MLADLDNTILDFDSAERGALRAAFRRLGIPFRHGTLERYRAINTRLWTAYSRGEIAGAQVAIQRFEELLAELEYRLPARRLARAYLAALRLRGDTLPGARRALVLLRRRFRVAVVTNGYTRVQKSRLRRAGLLAHVDALVTSESAGHAKPDPRIVHSALRLLGVSRHEAILVGDDLRTDQGAATAARMPFYWIDSGDRGAGRRPRLRVRSLLELAERL